jgi:predicted nucleotidyltransferase component of viral defense system
MRDAAASIRARLLNLARAQRLEFQSVLTRYGIERLLYCLSVSPHVDRFVLKGAQLLLVHAAEPHRPTKDLDLLGLGSDDTNDVAQVFREVCAMRVADDGLEFAAGNVRAAVIRETARYGGVRVRLMATLERARIPLQVDVGFGDVVMPAAELISFPVLLDGPVPTLQGYPLATVVAEKLETLTQLGLATSRMKDLYDLWYSLRTFELREADVRAAIVHTFHRRGTTVEATPVALTEAFWRDASKRAQWTAFLDRNDLQAPDLETVAREIAVRLAPMMPT